MCQKILTFVIDSIRIISIHIWIAWLTIGIAMEKQIKFRSKYSHFSSITSLVNCCIGGVSLGNGSACQTHTVEIKCKYLLCMYGIRWWKIVRQMISFTVKCLLRGHPNRAGNMHINFTHTEAQPHRHPSEIGKGDTFGVDVRVRSMECGKTADWRSNVTCICIYVVYVENVRLANRSDKNYRNHL